ncbi:MAG: oxygen-independent coproporphyrinogen III oxidase [Pseudomonadota bacterium]
MIDDCARKLVKKFSGSAPRYTSYPTAPNFSAEITDGVYSDWLQTLPPEAKLSIYAHIPFCDTLCWFCACRAQGTKIYPPVQRYLSFLMREIDQVAELLEGRKAVQMHWGGGSPTILEPADFLALAAHFRSRLDFAPDADFDVEIDPRDMTSSKLDGVAAAGVTRASLGVQDFSPEVQHAVNRIQSFDTTKRVVDGLRERGVRRLNIDALYGLPKQTLERVERTIDLVIELAPDRVALFGYAHVPWMAKRQKLIDASSLPEGEERVEQAEAAAAKLRAAGYQRIGLDHFARPDDPMAIAATNGDLKRNFQGYTVDSAEALIGFGASAIGKLPQGYVQNVPATAAYQRRIEDSGFAIERGLKLSADDRMRGYVIERLMCDLTFDRNDLKAIFGERATTMIPIAEHLLRSLPQETISRTNGGFRVTETGRPFVRNIAAEFDAYLNQGARYSRAV